MEFGLLGPLEVRRRRRRPASRSVARGLVRCSRSCCSTANQVVSTDTADRRDLGREPPASAQNALQVHVHTLRSALGADRIVTRAPGYLLRVEDGELDAERFEQLVHDGKPVEALALWRGPALADVAFEPFAQAEAARLEERRLAALEARIDADLDTGASHRGRRRARGARRGAPAS